VTANNERKKFLSNVFDIPTGSGWIKQEAFIKWCSHVEFPRSRCKPKILESIVFVSQRRSKSKTMREKSNEAITEREEEKDEDDGEEEYLAQVLRKTKYERLMERQETEECSYTKKALVVEI
jgi:hypothetical protein